MKHSTALAVAVLIASFSLGTSITYAQDGKGMGKGMGGMMMGQGMMGDCPMMDRMSRKVRSMMGGDMQALTDQRLATLKTQLAITPEQLATWDTYATALKKNATGTQAMRQTMKTGMSAKTPLERLDAQVTAMEARLAALKEVKPALSNLYTALSDEQKKKADKTVGCMM
jgi:LTXXQ motif family protein